MRSDRGADIAPAYSSDLSTSPVMARENGVVTEHQNREEHGGFDLWDPGGSVDRATHARRLRFLVALVALLALAALVIGWALLRSDITQPALVGIDLVA